ncbi:MAG: CCA tRNA nucleotidyltransferase [Candidatus Bathyarchaeota archaeon]|nr:CCA tRNA nucleotidyltransferase [Candidatus Termiticorpusculum sp.]MCL1971052.1 CCA tRNA nucleotidyltransferase [Candidatus Termiticorpusculum sp.]
MQTELEALNLQVLKKITPSPEEYSKVKVLSLKLEQKILEACQQQNVSANVRVEGSIAKDTWLKGDPDIDVFIRLPNCIPRKNLGAVGLKIARSVAVEAVEVMERFAEHPYLEMVIDGFRVDIVPCYDAKPGEWQSATDRTPYHTDYIRQHLTLKMRGEVRLLKQFMQSIGVYGAEIKVGGFSGYLCELLILTYDSFVKTVEAFAGYNKRVVIDLEQHFLGKEEEVSEVFSEPLVIVDPVDRARNVASAVQVDKLYSFIGAARAFIENPREDFFFTPEQSAFAVEALKRKLDNYGSTVLFLVTNSISGSSGMDVVPDVLWGQLYRSKRSLHKFLESYDYKVLRDAVWSNEKSLCIFIFELEQQIIAATKKHYGPPLERSSECTNFLSKYIENSQVIAGPYIEGDKWAVEILRKNTNAVVLLKEKLSVSSDGGKSVGISELIAKAFKTDLSVLANSEILNNTYWENGDFRGFLTNFLVGKPFWLIKKKK